VPQKDGGRKREVEKSFLKQEREKRHGGLGLYKAEAAFVAIKFQSETQKKLNPAEPQGALIEKKP